MEARRLYSIDGSTDYQTKLVKIISANYGFMPISLEMPKTFWVDLVDLPPQDLRVGTKARIHIPPVSSIYLNTNMKDITFEVQDILGSRVVLAPSSRVPNVLYGPFGGYHHSSGYPFYSTPSPFGWGIETTSPPSSFNTPSMTNVKFGFGMPVGMLEYEVPPYARW